MVHSFDNRVCSRLFVSYILCGGTAVFLPGHWRRCRTDLLQCFFRAAGGAVAQTHRRLWASAANLSSSADSCDISRYKHRFSSFLAVRVFKVSAMSYNYVVTAQKPTAVNACVTGECVLISRAPMRVHQASENTHWSTELIALVQIWHCYHHLFINEMHSLCLNL